MYWFRLGSRIRLPIVASCIAMMVAMAGATPSQVASHDETGTSKPAPKAVTPFTAFEFGDVYTGEVVSQIFVIRNDGNAELQIRDFKAG